MDERTCMVDLARYFLNFTQKESCGKCIPCREGTKRMLEILEGFPRGGQAGRSRPLHDLAFSIRTALSAGWARPAPTRF